MVELDDQVAGNLVESLVKSNPAIVEEIDKDPKLREQYERDMSELQMVKKEGEKLTALLYESLLLTTQEDEKYKWIDIQNGRDIPYRYLRRAGETEIPAMIKNLRRLQLTDFAELSSSHKYGRDTGFSLVWKNPNFKPNHSQKLELEQWEARFQQKLFFPAGDTRPSLAKFLGQMYNDFFDVDDITIRIHRDGLNNPIGLQLEDPSLWKPIIPKVRHYPLPRVDEDLLDLVDRKDNKDIELPEKEYVMIRGDERWQAVTRDHLIKSHFFLRTEHTKWRRGYSVMEQSIRIATIILNAIIYNASNFSTNRTPMGVLAMTGGMSNPLQLEKLKKILWATMTGVGNQQRLPIIGVPEKGDVKWVNIHSSPKELEFYTGLTLFVSIVCALSGTNPNELGIASFQDAMKGNRLNEENKDGVWKQSRDNGLKTFLNHAENTLNTLTTSGTTIFEEITRLPVKIAFKGLADEDLKAKMNVNKQRIAVDTSINDIRKENGDEPAELMLGEINIYDMPAIDSTAIQSFIRMIGQQKQQQEAAANKQQQTQQTQAGQPGQQDQQQGGEDQYSEKDRQLIEQYGEPENIKNE